MARKMCHYCQMRPATNLLDSGICEPCYDYQGWENAHSDEGHDEENYHAECSVCNGTPDPETTPPAKGHSNGIKKSHTSHAACKHESTKAARAKCRKERAQSGE